MMISRANAVRYARDLFDVAWRHNQAAQVADELDAFAAVQRAHTGEARPLFHPLVPVAGKVKTIHELSAKLGLSKPTTVLLEALAHAYQIHVLEWVAASFRDRLNRKTGVVQAKVTTAATLLAYWAGSVVPLRRPPTESPATISITDAPCE